MGIPIDFDDRQTHIDAKEEEYHPYQYQDENNSSWAGALPVKQ
jgi:glutamate synthase (NADPH/NADH)